MGGSTWSRFSAGSLVLSNSGHFKAKHEQDVRSPIHEWIPKVDNTASLVEYLQEKRGPHSYRILPVEKNGRALSLKKSESTQRGDQVNEKYTFKVHGTKS